MDEPHVQAARIVDALIADMAGRKGLGNEWDECDRSVRRELRATWLDKAITILNGRTPQ